MKKSITQNQQKNSGLKHPGKWIVVLLLKALAHLPFGMLYCLSDVLYFLMTKVFRYRSEVITDNLKNAFPEKNEKEIRS